MHRSLKFLQFIYYFLGKLAAPLPPSVPTFSTNAPHLEFKTEFKQEFVLKTKFKTEPGTGEYSPFGLFPHNPIIKVLEISQLRNVL
jgi:hypothetical protein